MPMRGSMIATLAASFLLAPGTLALAAPQAPDAKDRGAGLDKASVKELVDKLTTCKSLETCEIVLELKRRGPKIWPGIEAGLLASDEMTRFWTLGVLSEVIIADARPAIGKLIKDKEIRVRAAAAFALGNHRDKAVTPWLLQALRDKDLNVRFAAVVAMGRVKDPKTVEPLMGALRDKDEDVRGYAALALGDIGDRRATDRLLERCDQDSNAQVRGFAAMALGKLKDPKSLEPMLLRLEEEKDAKALAASVFAVGELRAPKARPALERLTKHEDPDVSAYAKEAVKALGGKPVTE